MKRSSLALKIPFVENISTDLGLRLVIRIFGLYGVMLIVLVGASETHRSYSPYPATSMAHPTSPITDSTIKIPQQRALTTESTSRNSKKGSSFSRITSTTKANAPKHEENKAEAKCKLLDEITKAQKALQVTFLFSRPISNSDSPI